MEAAVDSESARKKIVVGAYAPRREGFEYHTMFGRLTANTILSSSQPCL